MLRIFNTKPGKILRLLIISITLLVIISAFIYHIRVIRVEAPQELRENAIIMTTNLLLHGKNPYALENMPVYTNAYGILYNLLLLPFAWLFGSTFLLHRLLSLIFIFGVCYLIYRSLREDSVPIWWAIIPPALLYSQLIFGESDMLSRPDSLGLFLFVFSIYIARKLRFGRKGLSIALIASLLGFMAKPYFILGILYIVVYLFFCRSKMKSIVFLMTAIVSSLLVFLILQLRYETYFLNVIFINIQVAGNSVKHLMDQLKEYFLWNFATILSLFGLLILFFRKNKSKIKLSNLDIYSFALLLSICLVLFKFGLHTGNYMTYLTQLITPFLFLVVSGYLYKIKERSVKMILIILIMANLLLWLYKGVVANQRLTLDMRNEQIWSSLLMKYHHIYTDGLFANILYSQNKVIYDTGQSEYFIDSIPLSKKLSFVPEADAQTKHYYSKVRNELIGGKFDLVLTARDIYPFDSPYFTNSDLFKHYRPVFVAPYTMYNGIWMISAWIPITDKNE